MPSQLASGGKGEGAAIAKHLDSPSGKQFSRSLVVIVALNAQGLRANIRLHKKRGR